MVGHSESDPWVILRTVPRVRAHDGDLSFEIADPPHLSFLSVSTRVSPAPPSPPAPRATNRDPRIISADLSASLFLPITPKPHPNASSSSAATPTDPCCFVLDAAASSAHRIPDPARGFTPFGVIAAPDRASFMVVGLRCQTGNGRAELHCFSSRTGVWVTKDVNIRRPRPRRALTFSDVVAHDGKLWWVDTSTTTTKGLLYCDPFADQPSMAFVPLPKHVAEIEARAQATSYDRVQVADGKLRWVHVLCDLDETVDEAPILNGAPLHYIYALLGNGGDDDDGYRLDFELIPHWRGSFSLCFISKSDTLNRTPMPKDDHPLLALIDPNDTDLLYFFLGDYLFGYDIFNNVVLGYARHRMDVSSSSSLLAWKLPPALAAPAARRYGRRPNNCNGGANSGNSRQRAARRVED